MSESFKVSLKGDKSITHRAFIFAALAEGRSVISNVGGGEDLASTRRVLSDLGVSFTQLSDDTWAVEGLGGIENFREPQAPLNCGNSGTTMRLMAGLLSGCRFEVTLCGDESLSSRPMRRLERVLQPLDRSIETHEGGGSPIIVGGRFSQRSSLVGDHKQDQEECVLIDTQAASAQLKSAALLAALSDDRKVVVKEKRQSRDHSERMLGALWHLESKAEIPARLPHFPKIDFVSPGDFSSAGFWIAISALSPPRSPVIQLDGLNLNPTRMGLARIVERMGVKLESSVENVILGEPVGTMKVSPLAIGQTLNAVTLSRQEVVDALDELPIVALLASFAEGESVIRGAQELRVKESDRIEAMTQGLRALGVTIESLEDGWRINGKSTHTVTHRCMVDSFGDHRIAMCFLIAQLKQEGLGEISIRGSECLAISYPEFPIAFDAYRAQIRLS